MHAELINPSALSELWTFKAQTFEENHESLNKLLTQVSTSSLTWVQRAFVKGTTFLKVWLQEQVLEPRERMGPTSLTGSVLPLVTRPVQRLNRNWRGSFKFKPCVQWSASPLGCWWNMIFPHCCVLQATLLGFPYATWLWIKTTWHTLTSMEPAVVSLVCFPWCSCSTCTFGPALSRSTVTSGWLKL